MELRDYWTIIARRWWVIVAVTVVAFVLAVFLAPRAESRWVSSVRVAISIQPEPVRPNVYNYDRFFYAFQAAEFLVDDFAGLVRSRAFAEDVARILNDPTVSVGEIEGSRSTEKSHRLLTILTTTNDPERSRRIAEATVTALKERGPFYFRQLSSQDGVVEVIDPPATVAISGAQRTLFDIAVRTALGLVVGIALVFVLAAIDTSIYTSRDIERWLGVPVIGEVPPDRLAGT